MLARRAGLLVANAGAAPDGRLGAAYTPARMLPAVCRARPVRAAAPLLRHGPIRRTVPARASAAAAVAPLPSSTSSSPVVEAWSTSEAAAMARNFPAVPPLPPPPASGTLVDVVPYLIRLALAERHRVWRVCLAMCCMIVSKFAGISLPMVFKGAVDAMQEAAMGNVRRVPEAALTAVLLYCSLDCLKGFAKELQQPIFTPVSQAVTRRVAYHTFDHVLNLDTKFHLDRRTGRVSRILERGTRSIAILYRALFFTFTPTLVELLCVCGLLASRFGPTLAMVVGATFVAYVTWSISMTQMATEVRKEVNALDNATTSKAVDALLNYETLTLFNNQRLEVTQYDGLLRKFQLTAIKTEWLSAFLNIGQSMILAMGMAGVLTATIFSGGATGGDLVLAAGLITQLWAPLQFLGWFYRELRSALVDMEDFFAILQTKTNIKDGRLHLPPTAQAGGALSSASASSSSSGSGTTVYGSNGNGASHSSGAVSTFTSHAYGNGNGNGVAATAAAGGAAAASATSPAVGSSSSGRGLRVELRDVHFGYLPERQILKGISLHVAPGESVAVVGSSGSGKSTVLKLVTRLYDVTPPQCSGSSTDSTSSSGGSSNGSNGATGSVHDSLSAAHGNGNGNAASCSSSSTPGGGCVLINGVDVRDLYLQELRDAIAVVPQDTVLNYDTVLENIRYGRPDATDEEVVAAAKQARLHDTIVGFEKGYDTMVGERGLKLSGGEKQRVAIARAFLRCPRLLICDEATSALDSATEAAIMASLTELAAGRSALFVAHRLSTVRNCDRIVVLRGGRVVEEGSHDLLMATRGEYAQMWEFQASQDATRARTQQQEEVEGDAADGQRQEDQDGSGAAATPGLGARAGYDNGPYNGEAEQQRAEKAQMAVAAAARLV